MVSTDVGMISYWLQGILLCIHQYGVYIFYKPGPELNMKVWLSHYKDTKNRDQEISEYEHHYPNNQHNSRHPNMHTYRGHKSSDR